jgi:hypothetical protein
MKPRAVIASGLIFSLLAGPALAQSQAQPPASQSQTLPVSQAAPPAIQPQTQTPPVVTQPEQAIATESLNRIREAVGREPTVRIENGQLKIYAEVIGNWPSFAEHTQGYDFVNGPTGYGNPMSHQEFVEMMTPKDMYSTAGIQPAEILTMAAVNAVGQWAIVKALNKIGTSRKEKQLRDIRAQIDADLAAIKKEKDK